MTLPQATSNNLRVNTVELELLGSLEQSGCGGHAESLAGEGGKGLWEDAGSTSLPGGCVGPSILHRLVHPYSAPWVGFCRSWFQRMEVLLGLASSGCCKQDGFLRGPVITWITTWIKKWRNVPQRGWVNAPRPLTYRASNPGNLTFILTPLWPPQNALHEQAQPTFGLTRGSSFQELIVFGPTYHMISPFSTFDPTFVSHRMH